MPADTSRPVRAFALLSLLVAMVGLAGCARIAEELSQAFGEIIGRELGSYLLMPAVLTGICWWIAHKTAADKTYAFPIGITAAQGLIALLGVFLQAQAGYLDSFGGFLLGLLEVVWIAAATVWLATRPGLAPVALLIAYQALAIFNRITMLGYDLPENLSRATYGHLIIHIVAVIALVLCYLSARAEGK